MLLGWSLRSAVKRFPPIVYAWGVVGVAAAGGLVVHSLGAGPSAIKIWLLTFLATVIVAVFAQGVSGDPDKRGRAGTLLIWAITLLFCLFLAGSTTALMGFGPSTLERFWGVEANTEPKIKPFATPPTGQVNFGCERGATAPVEYHAPPGYRVLNAHVEPIDVKSAKRSDPSSRISEDGHSVYGKVEYFGKNRNLFGDCNAGGGHGKARIVGELILEPKSPVFPSLPVLLLAACGLTISFVFGWWNGRRRPPSGGGKADTVLPPTAKTT